MIECSNSFLLLPNFQFIGTHLADYNGIDDDDDDDDDFVCHRHLININLAVTNKKARLTSW